MVDSLLFDPISASHLNLTKYYFNVCIVLLVNSKGQYKTASHSLLLHTLIR